MSSKKAQDETATDISPEERKKLEEYFLPPSPPPPILNLFRAAKSLQDGLAGTIPST